MELDQLGQSGDNEVPLVGQAVAPASRSQRRVEILIHGTNQLRGLCGGEEVKVAAQIRPVIE